MPGAVSKLPAFPASDEERDFGSPRLLAFAAAEENTLSTGFRMIKTKIPRITNAAPKIALSMLFYFIDFPN
jgi:hypothetical protein